ncbi:MAG: hypothetical protein HY390_06300 [Deltaproteobacteria bacterium]|nr:hypothetical protein [Deltaproteobacteria bacterium]
MMTFFTQTIVLFFNTLRKKNPKELRALFLALMGSLILMIAFHFYMN